MPFAAERGCIAGLAQVFGEGGNARQPVGLLHCLVVFSKMIVDAML